jgi:hypothetical protein
MKRKNLNMFVMTLIIVVVVFSTQMNAFAGTIFDPSISSTEVPCIKCKIEQEGPPPISPLLKIATLSEACSAISSISASYASEYEEESKKPAYIGKQEKLNAIKEKFNEQMKGWERFNIRGLEGKITNIFEFRGVHSFETGKTPEYAGLAVVFPCDIHTSHTYKTADAPILVRQGFELNKGSLNYEILKQFKAGDTILVTGEIRRPRSGPSFGGDSDNQLDVIALGGTPAARKAEEAFKARKAEEEARKAEEKRKEQEAFRAAGFIALSESQMNWDDAQAYCQQQGGRLPLIGGGKNVSEGTPIEGFGSIGAVWPSVLSGEGEFWTGTSAGGPGRYGWTVHQNMIGGKRIVRASGNGHKGNRKRVVCVP